MFIKYILKKIHCYYFYCSKIFFCFYASLVSGFRDITQKFISIYRKHIVRIFNPWDQIITDEDSLFTYIFLENFTFTSRDVLLCIVIWHSLYVEYYVPNLKNKEAITKVCKKIENETLAFFLNEPYVEVRPLGQKEPICLPSLKDQETKVCAKVSKGGLSFEKGESVSEDSKSLT